MGRNPFRCVDVRAIRSATSHAWERAGAQTLTRVAAALLSALCVACAGAPPAPAWQSTAHDALARATAAYMEGNDRVADVEYANARKALTATGDAALVARVELTRCAARVAALVMDACDGFDRLRADAPDAERAYADYLAGRATPASAPLLPPQHRAIASGGAEPAAVHAIADPLSRLVACGVLFRTGAASPQVLQVATDTAAHEGWRRPLLAWLGVQARRAEQGGDLNEAQRLRRRMALVGGV